MKRSPPAWRLAQCRSALMSLALLCLVPAPASAQAPDAGVSGIAPGPGNVNGLNGSVRDPSGVGNANNLPPLPRQATAPVVPSAAPIPSTTFYPAPPPRRVVRTTRTRFAKSKYGRAAVNTAVKDYDRLLDRKLTSICRGC